LSASTLQVDSGEFINLQSRTLQDGAQSTQALWAYGVSIGNLPLHALTEENIRAFGIIPAPGQPNRRIAAAAEDYDNPYTVQASLGVSQQLGRDFVFEIAGQMYHGVHLPVAIEGNYRENGQLVPVQGMPGSDLFGPQLVRIDPTIAQKIVHSSEGSSIYYGMTTSLIKRFGHAYQFRASYSYGNARDNVLDFSGASTPYLPTRRYVDWGRSAYDLRHSFVFSGSFESPYSVARGHDLKAKVLGDLTFSPEGINLLNRANYLRVNDIVCGTTAQPGFISGCDPKFLTGPFDFKGIRGLPPTAPLAFVAAGPARARIADERTPDRAFGRDFDAVRGGLWANIRIA
jgi:hypothetical protein